MEKLFCRVVHSFDNSFALHSYEHCYTLARTKGLNVYVHACRFVELQCEEKLTSLVSTRTGHSGIAIFVCETDSGLTNDLSFT